MTWNTISFSWFRKISHHDVIYVLIPVNHQNHDMNISCPGIICIVILVIHRNHDINQCFMLYVDQVNDRNYDIILVILRD